LTRLDNNISPSGFTILHLLILYNNISPSGLIRLDDNISPSGFTNLHLLIRYLSNGTLSRTPKGYKVYRTQIAD